MWGKAAAGGHEKSPRRAKTRAVRAEEEKVCPEGPEEAGGMRARDDGRVQTDAGCTRCPGYASPGMGLAMPLMTTPIMA